MLFGRFRKDPRTFLTMYPIEHRSYHVYLDRILKNGYMTIQCSIL